MNKKQVLLYPICLILLFFSDIFAATSLALFLVFQMNILFNEIPLTRAAQLAAIRLFLFSIPLFLFLGGVHSMSLVYFAEARWLVFVACLFLMLPIYFLAELFCFTSFNYLAQNQFQVVLALQTTFNEIKQNRLGLFKRALVLQSLSLLPSQVVSQLASQFSGLQTTGLASDWQIVFALTVVQFFRYRTQLRRAF